MTHPLIIGHGEIGAAIAHRYQMFQRPFSVIELEWSRWAEPAFIPGVWHVCVPNDAVLSAVEAACERVSGRVGDAPLVIVHSTVEPGLCRRLRTAVSVRTGGGFVAEVSHQLRVVHAPVEGRHPHLEHELTSWQMPVAGAEVNDRIDAVTHLRSLGIPAENWDCDWETTEYAKLWSTTHLAVDVLVVKAMAADVDAHGGDGAAAAAKWRLAYNALYGARSLARPAIVPTPGSLGGHCLLGNAKILSDATSSTIPNMVLREGVE